MKFASQISVDAAGKRPGTVTRQGAFIRLDDNDMLGRWNAAPYPEHGVEGGPFNPLEPTGGGEQEHQTTANGAEDEAADDSRLGSMALRL